MIDQVRISNFKCFDQLELRCAPVTLLCGLNGMGKSSVIQCLLLLRQSFEARRLQHGRLALNGPLIDLGTGIDVLFEDAETDEIGVGFRSTEFDESWYMSFSYSPDSDQLRSHSFRKIPPFLARFPPFGGKLIHVQADRLGSQKLYPLSEVQAEVGEFGRQSELAWNVHHSRQNEQMRTTDPRCEGVPRRRHLDVLDHWIQDVSPGAHLEFTSVPDADAMTAGFSFDREGDVGTRRFRATNVGFGLSYVLPVVVALLSQPRTLCLIENPEAHIHPRGQTKLAELAVRSAAAGVQLLIETHSDHFLDGVRIAVRDGLLAPADVAIHYFERQRNATTVSSPDMDNDGRLSRWPEGFFDQHQENLVRLLKAKD